MWGEQTYEKQFKVIKWNLQGCDFWNCGKWILWKESFWQTVEETERNKRKKQKIKKKAELKYVPLL